MRGGAFGRLWRGEMTLADAFWTWAVAIGLIVNGGTSIACYALLVADRPIAALVIGYLLSVPFNVVATVGVLRSARRADADPALARVVQVVIIPVMVALSLT
jgi:hypothetical protein